MEVSNFSVIQIYYRNHCIVHSLSLYYLNDIYLDLGAQTSLEAGSVSQSAANERPVSGPVTNQRPGLVTEEESPGEPSVLGQ